MDFSDSLNQMLSSENTQKEAEVRGKTNKSSPEGESTIKRHYLLRQLDCTGENGRRLLGQRGSRHKSWFLTCLLLVWNALWTSVVACNESQAHLSMIGAHVVGAGSKIWLDDDWKNYNFVQLSRARHIFSSLWCRLSTSTLDSILRLIIIVELMINFFDSHTKTCDRLWESAKVRRIVVP